jgi:hypothetical protein
MQQRIAAGWQCRFPMRSLRIRTMRVLRVGTSNDFIAHIPQEQRGWAVASGILAQASGEPVETVLKRSWPTAAFAPAVARWMEEEEPDLVVLSVNNFWFGHESTALWFERKLGRAGQRVTKASLKVGKSRLLSDNRWGQRVNRTLLRVLPGATHFTIPQVAEAMENAIRKVLTHEGTPLLVRGHDSYVKLPMADERYNRRNRARNEAMSARMRAVCDRLHVPYFERPLMEWDEVQVLVGEAGWHHSVEGERLTGVFDGEAMVAVWRASQGVRAGISDAAVS